MYESKKIGVVVPAYNEELLITKVVETMPAFVDAIYIVDDKSQDMTVDTINQYIQQHQITRVCVIEHEINQGVGGAIITGYLQAIEDGMDVVTVMAGDAQMDPDDLPKVIEPVVAGECDYVKGNRLFSGDAWEQIPRVRYIGNTILSLMTKIASGYWHVTDSQTGYTAISREALETLPLDKLWKRYGYPNHLLIMLNIYSFRVRDVPIKPVYNIGEKSGIQIFRVAPIITWLLMRGFLQRMFQKYIIRDTHPLILFYFIGFITFWPGFFFGAYLLMVRLLHGPVAATSALLAMFLMMSGLNFIMFALWFDMDDNRDLR